MQNIELGVALCIGAAFFWVLIDVVKGSASEKRFRRKG